MTSDINRRLARLNVSVLRRLPAFRPDLDRDPNRGIEHWQRRNGAALLQRAAGPSPAVCHAPDRKGEHAEVLLGSCRLSACPTPAPASAGSTSPIGGAGNGAPVYQTLTAEALVLAEQPAVLNSDRPIARTANGDGLKEADHGTAGAEGRTMRRRWIRGTLVARRPGSGGSRRPRAASMRGASAGRGHPV